LQVGTFFGFAAGAAFFTGTLLRLPLDDGISLGWKWRVAGYGKEAVVAQTLAIVSYERQEIQPGD
jgi:hypothetical protein